MKTKTVDVEMASSAPSTDSKFLAPCVVAALVWLMLTLYIQFIVPAQLDLYEQALKPEKLRLALPAALRTAIYFHEVHGASIVSALGLLGCGLAYIRRSAKLANWMIAIGAVLLGGLVVAIMINVVNR